MPIPALTADGILPEGLHYATLSEVGQAFGQFQQTDQRPRVFQNLQSYHGALSAAAVARALIVDGSFITSKSNPSDVDCIVELMVDLNVGELGFYHQNLVTAPWVKKQFKLDLLVGRADSTELAKHVEFFEQVKHRPGLKKGLVKVIL